MVTLKATHLKLLTSYRHSEQKCLQQVLCKQQLRAFSKISLKPIAMASATTRPNGTEVFSVILW